MDERNGEKRTHPSKKRTPSPFFALLTLGIVGTVVLQQAVATSTVTLPSFDLDLASLFVTAKLTGSVGAIAEELDETPERIRKAIHKVKEGLAAGGALSNPDVVVDTETGEVYPVDEDGNPGDSIGNIFDALEEI